MKRTALIALTVLLAAACGKEIVPDNTVSDGTVTLQAGFVQDETKVDVSDAGTLTWKANDQIAVWTSNGSDGKFVPFTLSSGAGESTASFTGTPDPGYSPSAIAVYPAEAAKSYTDGNLTVNYPDTYNYNEGAENVRMAAWFTDASAGLQFAHLGGMIRFTINNIPASANSFKLVSSKTVAGDFAIGASKVAEAAAGESAVTISFPAGSITSGTGTFNVPVPVGEGFLFTAGLYKDDTAIEKTIRTTTKNIRRTDYLQMKAYTVSDIWYVKPDGTGHGSSWADATSLEKALASAEDGETIKMAAGTYKAASIPEIYASNGPADPITEGNGYEFYLVTSHITIEGGYAGSSESESPNYTSNATIIDGSDGAYHGIGIAAKKTEGKKVSIKGLTITNCTYQDGAPGVRTKDNIYLAGLGAAIVARDTKVEFENCFIKNNTATAGARTDLCTVYGGGDEAEMDFKNCQFSSNNNGAAVLYNHKSTFSLSDGSFISGNTGRAFHNDDQESITRMEGGSIHDNTFSGAGAVIFNKGEATFDGVEIYRNSGTYALFYNYNTTVGLTVSASDIYENTLSATSAGAILWSNSLITVNEGTNIRNHTGEYALKGNGGALYTSGEAILDHVRIKDNSGPNMIYVDNASASVAADSLTIVRNSVTSVGGVFNNAGGLLSVNNARIQSNSSTAVGAVLQAYKDGVDTYTYFSNSTIAQNTGTQRIMYLREKSHSVLTNCTIYANPTTTASQGGAIVLYGASSKISQAYLINCTVTGNGYNSGTAGGLQLYNNYTEAYLYNTMIAGNRGTNPRDMNPDHAGVKTKAYCALGNSSTLYRAAAFYRSDNSEITGDSINWEDGQFFGGDGASSRYTIVFDGTAIPLKAYTSATKPVGNPLMELGMPYSELAAISDPFGKGALSADILGKDQLGNSREGKTCIGAWAGN